MELLILFKLIIQLFKLIIQVLVPVEAETPGKTTCYRLKLNYATTNMISLFTAAAASVALVYGLRSSSAAEINTLPQSDRHDRKMADEIVTKSLRGYFIMSNPTEMPTYGFPTKSPSNLDFLSFVPTTEPPFYTALPTSAPSKAITNNDTHMPSNETPNAQKPSKASGLENIASKSNKASKASLITGSMQAYSALTKPSASPILTEFNPSGTQHAAIPSPSYSSQTMPISSQYNALCDLSTKWHPNIGFRLCTNSPDYPENWATMEHHYFYATLEACCLFVFGKENCNFENICVSQHLSTPSTESLTDESKMVRNGLVS